MNRNQRTSRWRSSSSMFVQHRAQTLVWLKIFLFSPKISTSYKIRRGRWRSRCICRGALTEQHTPWIKVITERGRWVHGVVPTSTITHCQSEPARRSPCEIPQSGLRQALQACEKKRWNRRRDAVNTGIKSRRSSEFIKCSVCGQTAQRCEWFTG